MMLRRWSTDDMDGGMSPVTAVTSLSSTASLRALHSAAEAKRRERRSSGRVRYSRETHMPDAGSFGLRTKSGHTIKNQAYFSTRADQNKWDVPGHAGTNTWKEWHGPHMRTDADMMERLDRKDEEEDHFRARKTFVNTMRVQTLDRFYNQRLNQRQRALASSWAPNRHSRREVHHSYETFESCLDEKPEKELKKVLTDSVLRRDREGIRAITARIQKEETWSLFCKQMERERRDEMRADFRERQAGTDMLYHMSGQPVSQRWESHESLMNCSQRGHELAQPRKVPPTRDVTSGTDFRGLIHADNEHALEQLFPGFGHELSMEFRARATNSMQAGHPAPPAAETPRAPRRTSREALLQSKTTVCQESIPTSSHRLEGIGTRTSDELYSRHSKVQFLPTTAPPPPKQTKTLLREDWSPATTMRDRARITGDFARTDQSSPPLSPTRKSTTDWSSVVSSPSHAKAEGLPPPLRTSFYPVLVPASPAKPSDKTGKALKRNESAPASLSQATSRPRRQGRCGSSAASAAAPVTAVCRELDEFEARAAEVPKISNFFSTPRASGAQQ